MPGFSAPLWLLALAIIPLIRWLHRWQVPMSAWPVSAIFLWDRPASLDAAGSRKTDPDPAWRRRAVVVALLITALSNPYWQSEVRSLTVWVDDSLSMFTTENGTTRLAAAFETLADLIEVDAASWSSVELRSLANPGVAQPVVRDTVLDADNWSASQNSLTTGPPASLMSSDSSHWLLSDGASELVQAWSRRAGVDRVLQSGTATENSAVTRIAVRRGLRDEDGLDILVAVSNTGIAADARTLELRDEQALLASAALSLPPGETVYWQAQVVGATGSLSASLAAGDALVLDDELAISLDTFVPVDTVVDDGCPPALRRALAAHPALRSSANRSGSALRVSCLRNYLPDDEPANATARIRALISTSEALGESPAWYWDKDFRQDFTLARDWLAAAKWPDISTNETDRVMLQSGGLPLVVVRDIVAGVAATVDTVVDLSYLPFTRQPEYAAFVATLVDLALQRTVLDATASASREVQSSVIIPAQLEAGAKRTVTGARPDAKSLSWLCLLAALAILAMDTALFLRGWRGSRSA